MILFLLSLAQAEPLMMRVEKRQTTPFDGRLFNDEAVENSDTFDLLMRNKEYKEKKENSEEFKKKLEKKAKRKNITRKKKSLSGSRFIDHDKLIEKTQKTIGHSEITFFREEGNG